MSGEVAAPVAPVVVTTAPTAEDALDADILRFRKKAEARSNGVDGEDVEVKPKATENRAPDGKFVKADRAPDVPKSEVNPPKEAPKVEAKPDAEKKPEAKPAEDVEKIKAAHKAEVERHAQRAKAAEDKIGEWETMAERMLARFDAYQAQIKMLQEALQAHGGSIAPESVENVKLQERLKTYELAEERQKMALEMQQAQQRRHVQQRHQHDHPQPRTTRGGQVCRLIPHRSVAPLAVLFAAEVRVAVQHLAHRLDRLLPLALILDP